jgi:hypothetical protein
MTLRASYLWLLCFLQVCICQRCSDRFPDIVRRFA